MFSHSSYHFWPPNFFLRISPMDKKDDFTQRICLEYFLSSTILCMLWPNESTYVVGTAWKESLFYKWEKKGFVCCCSWFISRRPGETARPRPWIRISSTVTASPPVALTAKRATWWTTATAAWCTCPVGNLPTCCIKDTSVKKKPTVQTSKIHVNVCFLRPRRCALLHPRAVQRMCSPSSRWEWKGFVCNQR